MKRVRTTLLLVFFAAIVAACTPAHGEVIGKTYTPPYTTRTAGHYTSTCWSYKSNGLCRVRGRTWVAGTTHRVASTWSLKLRDGKDVGWRTVSEIAWLTCDTGETFNGSVCR